MTQKARKRPTFGRKMKDLVDTQVDLYSLMRKKLITTQSIAIPRFGSASPAPGGGPGVGDNLGNHIATKQLLMSNFPVRQVDYIEFKSVNRTINDLGGGVSGGIRYNVSGFEQHQFAVNLFSEMFISKNIINVSSNGLVKKRIEQCQDPIAPQDVATKAYVDRMLTISDPNTIGIAVFEHLIESAVIVTDSGEGDTNSSEALSESVVILTAGSGDALGLDALSATVGIINTTPNSNAQAGDEEISESVLVTVT